MHILSAYLVALGWAVVGAVVIGFALVVAAAIASPMLTR